MYKESKIFQITGCNKDIYFFRFGVSPSGDIVVVWQELGDGYSIHCCRYSSEGVALGAPFQIALSQNSIDSLSVYVSPSGDIVVVWREWHYEDDGYSIQCCRYSSEGVALGEPFQIARSKDSIDFPSVDIPLVEALLLFGGNGAIWL